MGTPIEHDHLKTGQVPATILHRGRTTILAGRDRPRMLMDNRIVECGLRAPLKAATIAGSAEEGGPSGTYYICFRWVRKHGAIHSNPGPLARQADGTPYLAVISKAITIEVAEEPLDAADYWQVLMMEAQESIWHIVADVPVSEDTYSITLDNFTLQTKPMLFSMTGLNEGVLDNSLMPACKRGAVWLGRLALCGQDNVTLDALHAGRFRVVNEWFDRDAMDEGASMLVAQDLALGKRDLDEEDDDDTEVYYTDATALEEREDVYYTANGANSYTFYVPISPTAAGIVVGDELSVVDADGDYIEHDVDPSLTLMEITAVDDTEGAATITVLAGWAFTTAANAAVWAGARLTAYAYRFYPSSRPSSADIGVGDTVNLLTSLLAPVETNAQGLTVVSVVNDADEPSMIVEATGALETVATSDDWEGCGFSVPPTPPNKQIRGVVHLTPTGPDGHFNGSEPYKELRIDGRDKKYVAEAHLSYRRLRLWGAYDDPRESLALTLEQRTLDLEDVYYVQIGNGAYTFYVTSSPTAAGVAVDDVVDIVTIETDEGVRPVAVERSVVAAVVTAVGDVGGAEYVSVELVDGARIETAATSDAWEGAGVVQAEDAMTGLLYGMPYVFFTRWDADGINDEAVPPLNFEMPPPLRGHMPVGLGNSNDSLVIFTESECCIGRAQAGLGRPYVSFDEQPIPWGLIAPDSLVAVPKEMGVVGRGDLLFIGSGGRLCRYSGGAIYDESRRLNVHEYLDSVTEASWAGAVGAWDSNHGWYVVSNFNPSGDPGQYGYCFVWDVEHDMFFIFKEVPETAMAQIQDSDGAWQFVFGDEYGFLGVGHIDGLEHRDRQLESERQAGESLQWVQTYLYPITVAGSPALALLADTINDDGIDFDDGDENRPLDFPTAGDGLKGVYVYHQRRQVGEADCFLIYRHRIASNTATGFTLEEDWDASGNPVPESGDIISIGGIHVRWTSGIVGADTWGEKQLKHYAVRIANPLGVGYNMLFSVWGANGLRDMTKILTTRTRLNSEWEQAVAEGRGKLLPGLVASDFVFALEGLIPDLTITQIQIGVDMIRGELTE